MTPLQRLRALLDASTKGPWCSERAVADRGCGIIATYEEGKIVTPTRGIVALATQQVGQTNAKVLANAAFIVAARNQMDRLLAVAEAGAHLIKHAHAGSSEFIKENGRFGKSPWAEFVESVAALQSTENTDD